VRPFARGAALVGDDAGVWVLLDPEVDTQDGRGLGGALVWAWRQGARRVDVVTAAGGPVMARRAAAFAPPIGIWEIDGATLRAALAARHSPSPPDPRHLALVPDIEAAGARPNVEHGVVAGEVRGLEVCRVVSVDEHAAGAASGVRLEVGVGAHDREAFRLIHGDRPTGEALAGVVAAVAAARDVGVPGHPLNRLAPERFLRWRLEMAPEALGLVSLHPTPPPVPRRTLNDPAPCVAVGRRPDGTAVTVAVSTGVDLDVIPFAADARLAVGEPGIEAGGGSELWVVAPERDLVAATRELAAALRHSVTLVASPLSAATASSPETSSD
jgi:hypothetical protein